jgi:hypothetical protein
VVLNHILGELRHCDHHHSALQDVLQERWGEFKDEVEQQEQQEKSN